MKSLFAAAALLLTVILVDAALYLTPPPAPKFDADAARAAAQLYKARIVRDAYGVPHIFGARDADVAFGLAYAHAQDDWSTFEETLLFTRGALAARSGKQAAATDYLIAALGVWPAVRAKYESDLSPETRAIAEAYAAGLNFFCAQQEGLCSKGVAPITGHDIVAGFSAKTPFFYGLEDSLKDLFADDGAEEAVRTGLLRLPPGLELGSNAMAVAPSRSADGATRLLVNSHQPFTGPVAWYEARVESGEGWNMIGGVFPGAPLILHGATPDLGWAFTVNKPDLVDVYALEVDDAENPSRYRFEGQWRLFETDAARFRVHLFGPFSLPIARKTFRSIHGPAFRTPRGWRAVSFAGDGDIRAMEQWRRMNKARDFEAWSAAMSMQAIPSFNVIYADRQGRIGYFYNAALSVRSPLQDWTQTAPGDRAELVRGKMLPLGTGPSVVSPSSGFVVNANNEPWRASAPADSPRLEDYPAHLGVAARSTNRGMRALALLESDASITAEEFIAYKMDDKYDDGSLLVQTINRVLADEAMAGDAGLEGALTLLRTWNGEANRNDRAAALAIRFGRLRLGPLLNGDEAAVDNDHQALAQAARELTTGFGRLDPQWGDANRLRRGAVDLPVDGGPDTLRAIYTIDNPADGPMTAMAGDTYILVAEWLADGSRSIRTVHQFGSATTDPSSPHYADQAAIFAEKGFRSPPLTLSGVLAESTIDQSLPD